MYNQTNFRLNNHNHFHRRRRRHFNFVNGPKLTLTLFDIFVLFILKKMMMMMMIYIFYFIYKIENQLFIYIKYYKFLISLM